jgi:2-iminobutanoate/2-iminopropanoate deaminase
MSTTRRIEEAGMPRRIISGPDVPTSSLPFSQLVEADGFVFLAGQVGGVPGGHGAVPGGIEAETRQMLENVGQLLRAAQLGFGDVVQATVYLRDFADFPAMNAVFREYFPVDPPARATVGVSGLAADYSIEIVWVAVRP